MEIKTLQITSIFLVLKSTNSILMKFYIDYQRTVITVHLCN